MNPFAELTLPIQNRPITKLSFRQLASLLNAPLESSAAGVRDRAILQLLSEGICLYQLHNLDLKHIDPTAHSLILPTRSKAQELILLPEAAWARLQRWLIIRKLFAVNTEAVFLSLHWTAGRSRPGTRLSERSMRTIITKYLAEIGAKQPGVNSLLIAKSANIPHNRILPPIGENT
jgi:site-specific recombinase XerC